MNKIMHIILICVLVGVSVWSIITQNWHILITNICVISGVLIDNKINKLLKPGKCECAINEELQKLPMCYMR